MDAPKSCHDSMGLLKNCQTPHGQKLRLRKMKLPRPGFIIQANSPTNGDGMKCGDILCSEEHLKSFLDNGSIDSGGDRNY